MAIVERIGHLIGVLCWSMLVKSTVLGRFQVTIEFTLGGQLECDVDFAVVMEPGEETKDVRVSEVSIELVNC